MNILLQIIYTSAPLVIISLGALISEYTGRMALFIDGLVNLSAFLCFLFTVSLKNTPLAMFFTLLFCAIFIAIVDFITVRTKSNAFLIGLAINLLCSASVSFLSSVFFGTRGVVTSANFSYDPVLARIYTTILIFAVGAIVISFLHVTKSGLYLRITGSDSQVLLARGINPTLYQSSGWIIASVLAAIAGCALSQRLSSYVPNISSGRGWTALAAVYLGKKNTAAVMTAAFIIAAAEFAANNAQNIALFSNVPSSLLLALPYFVALILIAFR